MNNTQPKKKNGLSTAGFICSLCGFITCGLTSIIGLILSIIGLSNSKKAGESDGLAIAGIIISAIPLAIGLLFIVVGAGSSLDSETSTTDNPSSEIQKEDSTDTKKEETNKNSKNDNKKTNEKFTMIEHYKSDESNMFAMYIEGKIKNNKNKSYSYVQVTFTTYDSDGNVIGSCMDNINNLDANGTWKFKAICLDNPDNIDHYVLKEITGW